ncbi:MAG: hypothetical protein AAFR41_12505 [Pseudomonadota bacterium]
MRFPCLVFAATACLSACSGGVADVFDARQNAGPCPPALALYDAARVITFDGTGELFNDIRYTGEITDVRLQCRYAETDPIRAELEIDFAFGRGPASEAATHDYPYFVAITRRDAKVLERADFVLTANFRDGTLAAVNERISDIVIPRVDGGISGANFEIVVGFDLTEDELQFNRDGKRFRLDAQVGRDRSE